MSGQDAHHAYPWQCFARALTNAIAPSNLLVATTAIILVQMGDAAIDQVWPQSTPASQLQPMDISVGGKTLREVFSLPAEAPIDPVLGVPLEMTRPVARFFQTKHTWSETWGDFSRALLRIAVWGIAGLWIARSSVILVGQGQRVHSLDGLRFARRKWLDIFAAPSAVLLALGFLGLPIFALSGFARFDMGAVLIALLWGLVLLMSAVMTVLAVGLTFSWPLMWSAIAAEDSDCFDAISRSYAYVLQRPGHFLLYTGIASVLGIAGWLVAWMAAEMVVELAFWSLQVGAGAERTQLLRDLATESNASAAFHLAARWIGYVNHGPRLIACGFSYAYFWSAVSALYLLLRLETDGADLDDIAGREDGS